MAEFFGEQFDAPDRINHRRVNRIGQLARDANDAQKRGDADAGKHLTDYMAAVEDLCVVCVRPEDRARFDALCDEKCPTDKELMLFTGQQVAEIGRRPTQRSSGSADGPETTTPNSEGDSSSRAIARAEADGRPDNALVLLMTQEQRSA